jgi:hypothetical protein
VGTTFAHGASMNLGSLSRTFSALLIAATLAAAPVPVPAADVAGPWVAPSTQEMAALLEELVARVDPVILPFAVNGARADAAARQIRKMPPSAERLKLRSYYARELLGAGREGEALQAIESVLADMPRYHSPGTREATDAVLLKAMAHMRTAESLNCCQTNNRDSCLLPIRGEGIHRRREGATLAIQTLMDLLETQPDNLRARWLLNIAHMTLGSHPDGVPKPQVIPPNVFASEYPLPRFPNVAREVGLSLLALAGGAVLEDFDDDGRLDLMVSSMGLDAQMRFFHNPGDGRFVDRTDKAGLLGETGGLNMVPADYDNDGRVDVLVLRGGWMQTEGRFPASLLRNNGDGTFTDVTRAAGLLRFSPTQTAAWLDYDGDGHLDLFIGNESAAGDPHPCELFHNNGDGTFTEVGRASGVNVTAFVKGVAAGDYDNDGRPDLYVSVLGGDNVLFHNEGQPAPGAKGAWRFRDVTRTAGVAQPWESFGTFFFDYDNDGWQDLFVIGYGLIMAEEVAADFLGLPTNAERLKLFRNRRDGTFEDVTKAVGLYRVVPGMGHNFGDLDNDGFLDVYIGTGNPELSTLIPNRMFRNAEGRLFQDVTTAGNFGHLQKGHAVAFGDLDNDGDQDIFEQMGGAFSADTAWSALYENPGRAGRWIGLDLEGVRSNRKALGARIEVRVETPRGPRSFHRVVSSGGSFGGSPFRQHVGIGDATRVVSVKVFWPATGKTQELTGLEPGRWHRIREGDDAVQRLDRPAFALASSPDAEKAALRSVVR